MFGRLEVVLTQAAHLPALGRAQEPFGGTIDLLPHPRPPGLPRLFPRPLAVFF